MDCGYVGDRQEFYFPTIVFGRDYPAMGFVHNVGSRRAALYALDKCERQQSRPRADTTSWISPWSTGV